MTAELFLVPIPFDEANEYTIRHHRHLFRKRMRGAKFSLGVATSDGIVVGVAIVGRPVARRFDDGWTLEVNRCTTDGTKNAPSFLYAAAWRVTQALGYRRLITYTLPGEGGASLRGAGWRLIGERTGGGSWSRAERPRVDRHPLQEKWRWEAPNGGAA